MLGELEGDTDYISCIDAGRLLWRCLGYAARVVR